MYNEIGGRDRQSPRILSASWPSYAVMFQANERLCLIKRWKVPRTPNQNSFSDLWPQLYAVYVDIYLPPRKHIPPNSSRILIALRIKIQIFYCALLISLFWVDYFSSLSFCMFHPWPTCPGHYEHVSVLLILYSLYCLWNSIKKGLVMVWRRMAAIGSYI